MVPVEVRSAGTSNAPWRNHCQAVASRGSVTGLEAATERVAFSGRSFIDAALSR